jgi:hypothetical protein
MIGPMRSVLLTVILLLPLFALPAYGGGSNEAERYRLQSEMDRLARRNVWKGVERTYTELLALEIALSTGDHLLGAQASQSRGEMLQAMERFAAAVKAGQPAESAEGSDNAPLAEAVRTLEFFTSRYGRVDIVVDKGRIAMLVRTDGMPFSAQERESIVYARDHVVKDKIFRGLLPIGNYMIDGEKFEITATDEWHEIRVN